MKTLFAAGKLAGLIIVNFAVIFLIATCFMSLEPALGVAAIGTAVSIVTQTFALVRYGPSQRTGLAFAGVQVEIWQKDIVENLYKNNDFILRSRDETGSVLAGKVVHIPQAGAPPKYKINRSQLPAQVTLRGDTTVTYELDEITTDPQVLKDVDKAEISYDKRTSLLYNHHETNRLGAAEIIMYRWAEKIPAENKLRTTGANAPVTLKNATGTRKSFTLEDIIAAEELLNEQDISKEGRCMLIPSKLLSQLKKQMTATDKRDFTDHQDVAKGIVGKLYTFDIYERSSTLVYQHDADNPTLLPIGAETTTDSCSAILFWQESVTERALGDVTFYENLADPTYYGDVYSTGARFGGRARRGDGKGVGVIVQAMGA